MPKTVYEQFDAAFGSVAAYTLHRGGRFIGRIAFKYPADGAGRLQCFAQVWGGPMTRATAGGGGYDKATAAAYRAVQALGRPNTADEAADSDALKGAFRDSGGKGVHFSGPGLREHGKRWADKVGGWIASPAAHRKPAAQ